MKKVYVVIAGTYKMKPVAVCQYIEDAQSLAISVNSLESNEDVNEYIFELPYLCEESPYDVNDIVATAVASTKKVYEDIIRSMNVPQQS